MHAPAPLHFMMQVVRSSAHIPQYDWATITLLLSTGKREAAVSANDAPLVINDVQKAMMKALIAISLILSRPVPKNTTQFCNDARLTKSIFLEREDPELR